MNTDLDWFAANLHPKYRVRAAITAEAERVAGSGAAVVLLARLPSGVIVGAPGRIDGPLPEDDEHVAYWLVTQAVGRLGGWN